MFPNHISPKHEERCCLRQITENHVWSFIALARFFLCDGRQQPHVRWPGLWPEMTLTSATRVFEQGATKLIVTHDVVLKKANFVFR